MTETPKNEPDKPKPRGFCGKPGRSGPPKANSNNMRHGLRAGKLPVGCAYIEIRMNIFRRELEAAVIAAKGEISLVDAANIQTAMKWERHGALALRWLTKEADALKPVERLTFSREVARASTERDRALMAIGLNRNQIKDQWTALDALPTDGDDDHAS